MVVRARRLDDRIRELCIAAIAANDSRVKPILAELQSLIHHYTQQLRTKAARTLTGHSGLPPERRKS